MKQIVLSRHVSIGIWMLSTLHIAERLLVHKIVLVLHLRYMHVLLARAEITRDYNYIMHCGYNWFYIIFFVCITRRVCISIALSSLAILSLIPSTNTSWWSLTLNTSCCMVAPCDMHWYIVFVYLSPPI